MEIERKKEYVLLADSVSEINANEEEEDDDEEEDEEDEEEDEEEDKVD